MLRRGWVDARVGWHDYLGQQRNNPGHQLRVARFEQRFRGSNGRALSRSKRASITASRRRTGRPAAMSSSIVTPSALCFPLKPEASITLGTTAAERIANKAAARDPDTNRSRALMDSNHRPLA
jgi:hypothetical protein